MVFSLRREKSENATPSPPERSEMKVSYHAGVGGCKKGLAGFWNIWLFKGNPHTGVLYA